MTVFIFVRHGELIVVSHGIVTEVMTGMSNTLHGGIVEMRLNS